MMDEMQRQGLMTSIVMGARDFLNVLNERIKRESFQKAIDVLGEVERRIGTFDNIKTFIAETDLLLLDVIAHVSLTDEELEVLEAARDDIADIYRRLKGRFPRIAYDEFFENVESCLGEYY